MIEGSVDIPIDLFGGLVLDMLPADLPPGCSPDCNDVLFAATGPQTRPGLGSAIFTALAGGVTVPYLKTFVTLTQALRAMVMDSNGNLFKENPIGTLAAIYTGLTAGVIANSVTLFGREWIATGDGKQGIEIPRQYDDTNYDRVSQVGPGAAPFASDMNFTYTVSGAGGSLAEYANANIVASPNGLNEVDNRVTVTTTTALPKQLLVGDSVLIAGAGVAGYNGTWKVTAILDPTHFEYVNTVTGLANSGNGTVSFSLFSVTVTGASTVLSLGWLNTPAVLGLQVVLTGAGVAGYNGTWPIRSIDNSTGTIFTLNGSSFNLANSSGGSVAFAGNIAAGAHQISVMFVTRQNYITAPAVPPSAWTAAGGLPAYITDIPTGPPNVTQRILCFTGAGGASFFYVPTSTGTTVAISGMVINDNTTTRAFVDFTDTLLFASTNVDGNFKFIELGECSTVLDYADRLFWLGERNHLTRFINLTFDGGIGTATTFPLGWNPDPTSGSGGAVTTTLANVIWGGAYQITGDGATATRGLITQSAFQDYTGTAILQPPNTGFSVRARVKRDSTLATGTLHVHLFSASGGINTTGLQVTAAQASLVYQEFSAVLTTAIATPPSDLVLRVFADGTPTNNGNFFVENIEVFPTNEPVKQSLVRVSQSATPEAYDGVTGFCQIANNDGAALRCLFKLRDSRIYFLKWPFGFYGTQDDQANEPNVWNIDTISKTVGTPSTRGADIGEDWAVIAARQGLYLFWGPEPQKVCQEIQPLWDRINWQYGHTLWTKVDTKNRRVLIGVPLDTATSPNQILYLDYRDLDTAQEIAASPPIHISYTGRKICRDKARKWSPWLISAAGANLIERPDGTSRLWLGNNVGNGKIYQLDPANAYSDDGVAINGYYTTYFIPGVDQEQMLQLRGHRKLFQYLTMFVEGSGTLNVSALSPGSAFTYTLPFITLKSPAERDSELIVNVIAERSSLKIGTNAVGSFFKLQKFVPTLLPEPWAPVRGF